MSFKNYKRKTPTDTNPNQDTNSKRSDSGSSGSGSDSEETAANSRGALDVPPGMIEVTDRSRAILLCQVGKRHEPRLDFKGEAAAIPEEWDDGKHRLEDSEGAMEELDDE